MTVASGAVVTAVVVAALAVISVLVWPPRRFRNAAAGVLRSGVAESGDNSRTDGVEAAGDGSSAEHPRPSFWRSDPVELYRTRRERRRPHRSEEAALELLDAIAPALRAGLTPARAFDLAGSVLPQAGLGPAASGARAGGRAVIVGAGRGTPMGARRGEDEPVAAIWDRWAQRSDSPDLAFIASAWQLSERSGAPLAEAVERAAAQLRSGLSRRRRLSAAIAGPRATVTVLTALPLTGPLFGLASGLSPVDMYLRSGLGAASLGSGLLLILLGRWWCGRIIRGAGAG